MSNRKGDNKIAGTVKCTGQGCDATATVLFFKEGTTREGEMYLSCSECGPDMRKKHYLQDYICENANFREEYSHLSTKAEVDIDPVPETEPAESVAPEEIETEEIEVLPPEETKKSKKGWIALGVGVLFVGVGVVLGVKPK